MPARALDCGDMGRPKVTLTRSEDVIQYDFSKNRAALNEMGARLSSSAAVGSSSYVGGLTSGTISTDMSTELKTQTRPDGSACLWISSVNVKLHYQPVVYISREFRSGTCHHAAVMEHEQKHVATDRALIDVFAPELQQAVEQAASTQGRAGPVVLSEVQSTGANINQQMENRMNQLVNALSIVRQKRQALIDTEQEYTRVQSLCQNWP